MEDEFIVSINGKEFEAVVQAARAFTQNVPNLPKDMIYALEKLIIVKMDTALHKAGMCQLKPQFCSYKENIRKFHERWDGYSAFIEPKIAPTQTKN